MRQRVRLSSTPDRVGDRTSVLLTFDPGRFANLMNDDQRLSCEQVALSIEWALDPPMAEGAFAENPYMAPEAASMALEEMVDQYPWLIDWVEEARRAALAEAAVELAKASSTPQQVTDVLRKNADKARSKLEKHRHRPPEADEPVEVLRAFALLQRTAATKPMGHGVR
jgi:hypothetical protein